jgi:hypothetical protein
LPAFDPAHVRAAERRRIRENKMVAGEKAVLDRFAKAAGAGELLNIQDFKAAYEEAIRHPTSNSIHPFAPTRRE